MKSWKPFIRKRAACEPEVTTEARDSEICLDGVGIYCWCCSARACWYTGSLFVRVKFACKSAITSEINCDRCWRRFIHGNKAVPLVVVVVRHIKASDWKRLPLVNAVGTRAALVISRPFAQFVRLQEGIPVKLIWWLPSNRPKRVTRALGPNPCFFSPQNCVAAEVDWPDEKFISSRCLGNLHRSRAPLLRGVGCANCNSECTRFEAQIVIGHCFIAYYIRPLRLLWNIIWKLHLTKSGTSILSLALNRRQVIHCQRYLKAGSHCPDKYAQSQIFAMRIVEPMVTINLRCRMLES